MSSHLEGELRQASKVEWSKAGRNELTERIYRILQKWVPYANAQYERWDGRPNCGHFFGGCYWYGLETAYTTSVYALLAVLGEYDETITGVPRSEIKEKAVSAIRYLGFTHDTGPEDCVRAEGRNRFCSLQKWGGRGKKFFPASQTGVTVAFFGLSAWLLWDVLDDESKSLVENVLVYYADRWSGDEPRNGSFHDTQCEENAWTAAGISAALGLFRHHPHWETWRQGFIRWSINSMSTYKDRIGESTSRVGRPEKRVKSTTFFPDFTTENHGFLHPGYICAGINLRSIHAVFALMGGQDILESAMYNNEAIYERTIKVWTQFDGLAVPLQGQDWWYNRHHERQLTHAFMNVVHSNADAARLERNCLDIIEQIQDSNEKGCLLEENGEQCIITAYQTAKDMEHTSAHDLVTSYLLHAFGGPGVQPSEPDEIKTRLQGVYHYPHGSTVINRTKNSFSSFSWRNRVMALTLPAKGVWGITPLLSSYTGTTHFRDGLDRNVHAHQERILDAEIERVRVYENGFGAVTVLTRGDNELFQYVAFVSTPQGTTFYAEQFEVLKSCKSVEINTGRIGVRNERYSAMHELATGRKTLYFPQTSETFAGFYGIEPDLTRDYSPASYVNLDNDMGYLLFGSRGIRYTNRHEYAKWIGVEDHLILNHIPESDYVSPQRLDPFMVITVPNQSVEETKDTAKGTYRYNCHADRVLVVETDDYLFYANFLSIKQIVHAHRQLDQPRIQLFEGSNRIEEGRLTWTGRLEGYSSGFLPCEGTLLVPDMHQASLDIDVLAHRMIIRNTSSNWISFMLKYSQCEEQRIEIHGGNTFVLDL